MHPFHLQVMLHSSGIYPCVCVCVSMKARRGHLFAWYWSQRYCESIHVSLKLISGFLKMQQLALLNPETRCSLWSQTSDFQTINGCCIKPS